jgi:hypothetical protein
MYLSPEPKGRQERWHYIQLFLIGLALVLVADGIALFPFAFTWDSYFQLALLSDGSSARIKLKSSRISVCGRAKAESER